jgi:hypothetical protein
MQMITNNALVLQNVITHHVYTDKHPPILANYVHMVPIIAQQAWIAWMFCVNISALGDLCKIHHKAESIILRQGPQTQTHAIFEDLEVMFPGHKEPNHFSKGLEF